MIAFKTISLWIMGVALIGAGLNHFRIPRFYTNLMPPYLPWHLELVYLSGVIEVLLGAGLLTPGISRYAAWGIVAMLIAFFPVHLHMLAHPEQYAKFPVAGLYVRLVLQFVLIAWAWWFTGR